MGHNLTLKFREKVADRAKHCIERHWEIVNPKPQTLPLTTKIEDPQNHLRITTKTVVDRTNVVLKSNRNVGLHIDWHHFRLPQSALTPPQTEVEGGWGNLTLKSGQTAADGEIICIDMYLEAKDRLSIGRTLH